LQPSLKSAVRPTIGKTPNLTDEARFSGRLNSELGRTTHNVSVISDAQNRADVPREEREWYG
jgi:hypothetical protein